MTARVCEWEGCEVEVTGRSTRCPEHQKEHRRKTDSGRKQKTRSADTTGLSADKPRPHLSASTPVSKDTGEVRMFSTFAPKVLSGLRLAPIDDAFTSRCIAVPMTRACPELRDDRDPAGEDVRRQCARWRDDHLSKLREADPEMRGRIGRIAQVWRPLLAIADAAGGGWPEKGRAAAVALAAVAGTFADGETLGTMLFADVRAVFEAKGNPERIQSGILDEALRVLPERPWESMPKTNKPLTAQARGRMLASYGVSAETLRFDAGQPIAKGYKRAAFAEAWNAYLPEGDGIGTVTPLQRHETSTFSDSRTVTGNEGCNSSESAETPAKQGSVRFNGSQTGVPGEKTRRRRCPCPRNRPERNDLGTSTGGRRMASERHGHPDYAPPSGEAWRALRERRRQAARDKAIAQWEREFPEFARRRAARAPVDEGTPAPGPNPGERLGDDYRRASDGE